MDKEWLYGLLIVTSVGALILYICYKFIERKNQRLGAASDEYFYRALLPTKGNRWKQIWTKGLTASYRFFIKVPFIKTYTLSIRGRIQQIHSYDETMMRKQTMKITILTLSSVIGASVLLLLMVPDITAIFMVIIMVFVFNGLIIDALISRVEFRLLKQLPHFNSDVRHHFHRHGMVEEAVLEAAEAATYEASLHGKKIHEVLTSNQPDEALEEYYRVAPSRFLKWFAGFSFLVMQFGDKVVTTGSMYLSALTRINNDINLEILKRQKLQYYLSSLSAIAVIPMFFISRIETWARSSFPAMDAYYLGQLGLITKILLFVTTILCYVLVRKLQENSEGNYQAKVPKNKLESWLYQVKPIKWFVDRFTPGSHTKEYYKIQIMLKDSNVPIQIKPFYLRRICLFILTLSIFAGLFSYMHHLQVQNILYAPAPAKTMFGIVDDKEKKILQEETNFDRSIINHVSQIELKRDDLLSVITRAVQAANDATWNDKQINEAVNRIYLKMLTLSQAYLKWWELLISTLAAYIAYQVPVWILHFQRKLRQLDMQNEVDEFLNLIVMLREFERMSVEMILEWMERYSRVFKEPLRRCLLNYESGAHEALEELKNDAPFVPFVRIIEKLQLATEKIPIKQAFDDLESDINYYHEKRRYDNERLIDLKSEWGRTIGFTPLYAVIFLYLVVPIFYTSAIQMKQFFTQIQNL
ncbi:hypothetical protein [Paenibacillus thiaminolyticus]|uniref:Uncharacterized protein n=1 Tax=Paenibacillus thiaminolyticus TaxID=49283 RepID=A0A3A3GCZ2_PANTH|nr:hypothetical protein [Paenibacillus thiaminolyticus]RJG21345.1 hypothetical protein DQX05_21835 [Paenibacillus thiaminolyticus]